MDESPPVAGLLTDLPPDVVVSLVERGSSPPTDAPVSARHRGARRAKFLDGRHAASDALRRLGVADRTVGVGPSGEPLWPAGAVGSISHARRVTVAVVAAPSRVGSIGVDVEDDREVREIESYVLTERESRWVAGVGTAERRRRLLASFSAKESIYKAFYPRVGRFFGFHAVTLEPTAGGFRAEFVTPVDPEYPAGRSFFVGSRWVGDLTTSWTILPPG